MERWTELILFALMGLFWVALFYFLKKQDEKGKDVKEDKEDTDNYLLKP